MDKLKRHGYIIINKWAGFDKKKSYKIGKYKKYFSKILSFPTSSPKFPCEFNIFARRLALSPTIV